MIKPLLQCIIDCPGNVRIKKDTTLHMVDLLSLVFQLTAWYFQTLAIFAESTATSPLGYCCVRQIQTNTKGRNRWLTLIHGSSPGVWRLPAGSG